MTAAGTKTGKKESPETSDRACPPLPGRDLVFPARFGRGAFVNTGPGHATTTSVRALTIWRLGGWTPRDGSRRIFPCGSRLPLLRLPLPRSSRAPLASTPLRHQKHALLFPPLARTHLQVGLKFEARPTEARCGSSASAPPQVRLWQSLMDWCRSRIHWSGSGGWLGEVPSESSRPHRAAHAWTLYGDLLATQGQTGFTPAANGAQDGSSGRRAAGGSTPHAGRRTAMCSCSSDRRGPSSQAPLAKCSISDRRPVGGHSWSLAQATLVSWTALAARRTQVRSYERTHGSCTGRRTRCGWGSRTRPASESRTSGRRWTRQTRGDPRRRAPGW